MIRNRHLRSSFRAVVVLLAGISIFLAGCGGAGAGSGGLNPGKKGSTGKEPSFDLHGKTVRITLGDDSAQSLGNRHMIAQLKKWGANVDTITLTTATGLSAVVAGRADFAAGQGADEAILGLSKGKDISAIGAPDSADSYVIIARKEINGVAGLRGKRIATSGPGGFNTALAHVALKHAGLNPTSGAEYVTIGGSPQRATALLSGQVDATVVFYADWAQIQKKSDKVKLLAHMDDIVPNIPDLYYYGLRSYWKANPTVAKAVACANLQANSIISTDKSAFVDFAAENIRGADRQVLSATYDELKKSGNWPTDPNKVMNTAGLPALQNLMIDAGEINAPVKTGGLVDESYLKQAAAMGCGAS